MALNISVKDKVIIDLHGRKVRIHESIIKKINSIHTDVKYVDIVEALKKPVEIRKETIKKEDVYLFYGERKGTHKEKYCCVVSLRVAKTACRIKTAYNVKKIKKGEVIYKK